MIRKLKNKILIIKARLSFRRRPIFGMSSILNRRRSFGEKRLLFSVTFVLTFVALTIFSLSCRYKSASFTLSQDDFVSGTARI
jgi:hypothetical protein